MSLLFLAHYVHFELGLGQCDKLSHSNDKDCTPFSMRCLELVTMQKYSDTTKLDTKDAVVKIHTLIN